MKKYLCSLKDKMKRDFSERNQSHGQFRDQGDVLKPSSLPLSVTSKKKKVNYSCRLMMILFQCSNKFIKSLKPEFFSQTTNNNNYLCLFEISMTHSFFFNLNKLKNNNIFIFIFATHNHILLSYQEFIYYTSASFF